MNKLSRYSPPGGSTTALDVALYCGGIMLAVLCIGFILSGEAVWQAWDATTVPPVWALFRPWMKCVFAITAIGPLLFIPHNYQYFRTDSRSIYVMRRIRSPWELHVRCWAVPLLGSLIVCGYAIVTYLLCCLTYFLFMPKGAVPEQLALIWRYTL